MFDILIKRSLQIIINRLNVTGRKSRTVSNQDSSKIPIVNNNNYSINDPSNLELDLADLDLSRLKLSQSELDALTSLTPNLSQRQQNQLLSQLPPTQARKLSRHLSLRLPKTSQQSDKEDNLTVNNDQTIPNPVELRTTPKSYSLRNSFRHSAEPQNDTNYNKKNDISAYGLINNSVDRQFDKYLPLQKASSLVDSNTDRVKTRKPTPQRRISRFLRPDFFDTPRDESSYAKEKRERELETQQVLREIRVKRDRSVDRCHASVSTDSSLSRDINTLKYIPKSLPSESTLHSEKESTCSEKTVANNEKTRRSSTELSKIARPKSLIMNKEDNTSNANEEISKGTKTNSISKLPTKQSKKESKLLRPKSYPNSSFSTKNGLSLSLKKEDENNIETKVDDEQNIVNDKKVNDKKINNDQTVDKINDLPVLEQKSIKEPANKAVETPPTRFLQTLGQTFDKLRNETKTKISKKSSKESTGVKEKTTTKQSALKLLKRKSVSSEEKSKTSQVESNSVAKIDNIKTDSDKKVVENDAAKITDKLISKGTNASENTNDEEIAKSCTSSNGETKDERKSRIENVIKSLRERSIPRGPLGYTESGLIKRAVSVEDVTGHLKPSRRSVSKVLDLFNKLETENNESIRKKDEAAVVNGKVKNKLKIKEPQIRPKSLVISNNAKTETTEQATENVDEGSKIVNDLTTNSKPVDSNTNFMSQNGAIKKPTTLKLDFSKINNYRNVLENPTSETLSNRSQCSTNSHLTNHYDYSNNNYKDVDPSDISSATTCLSPNYEPELAFDDWSICSDSVIHKNHMLSSTYSDVSPNCDSRSEMDHRLDYARPSSRSSYCNHSGLENSDSESIIDRIKRKSYYLRFNEKKQKRKSSIVGPGAKDYYSSSVFDNKSDRTRSKPTSPITGAPDTIGTIHKYRPKKSADLSKSISSDYDGVSSHIKRRESCSAFDYNRLNPSSIQNRNYFTLDTRTPKRYGRSYSNYSDSKYTTNQHDGIYGNYLTGMHSSKDILHNRDYHLPKDYIEPKSPYSRKSYISGCNGMYNTYNPSMSYSYHGSSRSHSKSSNSVPDHR